MDRAQHPLQRRDSTCDHEPTCTFAEKLSDAAADSAVKKVFAILGVDISKPESVEDFREDLRFGRKLRKVADHSLLAFFGVVAVAFAAVVWSGVVSKVTGVAPQ